MYHLLGTSGSKRYGVHAQREYRKVTNKNGKVIGYETIYRAPTEREVYEDRKFAFGESSDANARTPSRWHRQQREKKLRTHNKNEIRKSIKREDYETDVIYDTPSSHKWDWS